MKKRYYIVIAALLFGASVAKAQDHIKLDLQKTIQLANDSSLEAFRTIRKRTWMFIVANSRSMHRVIWLSSRTSI